MGIPSGVGWIVTDWTPKTSTFSNSASVSRRRPESSAAAHKAGRSRSHARASAGSYFEEAEKQSRRQEGHGLTGDKLEHVLRHYPGDIGEQREP